MRLGRDLGSGLGLLIAGAALTYSAADFGIGTLLRPRTGFLSFYLGLIILGAAAVLIVQALAAREDESFLGALRGSTGTLRILLPILVWSLTVDRLGFLLGTFLLMWWLFADAAGGLLSLKPIGWSVLATAATWLLFERVLGAGLPPMRLFG